MRVDFLTLFDCDFRTDGVHPHIATGHRLYVEAIARSFPKLKSASADSAPRSMPEPYRDDNWEQTIVLSIWLLWNGNRRLAQTDM